MRKFTKKEILIIAIFAVAVIAVAVTICVVSACEKKEILKVCDEFVLLDCMDRFPEDKPGEVAEEKAEQKKKEISDKIDEIFYEGSAIKEELRSQKELFLDKQKQGEYLSVIKNARVTGVEKYIYSPKKATITISVEQDGMEYVLNNGEYEEDTYGGTVYYTIVFLRENGKWMIDKFEFSLTL